MKKQISIMAVVAMALGALAFCVRADTPARPGETGNIGSTTRPASITNQVPQGIQVTRNADDSHIRETLANATQAVFAEKYGDLAMYITQANRDNVGDLAKLDSNSAITKQVDGIDKNWRSKYNDKFNAQASAFGPNVQELTIVVGQITNPTLLSNWPLKPNGEMNRENANRNEGKMSDSERALEGSNVAIVTFPAEHNLPEVTVSMIRQGNMWKIEIPENIDGKQLHDSLVHWLSTFNQATWPKDQNEGYRMACHYVMCALYNVQR